MDDLVPMIGEVRKLLLSADDGRVMSEGVKTVILGKPNAGKSSLMNVLWERRGPLLLKLRELPGIPWKSIFICRESVLMWWIQRESGIQRMWWRKSVWTGR